MIEDVSAALAKGVLIEHRSHDCTPPSVPNPESSYVFDCECKTRWLWKSAWVLPATRPIERSWWQRKRLTPISRIVVDGRWVLDKRTATDVVIEFTQ